MEKRFFLGAGILVLLLILGLLASWWMQQITHPISTLLEQASDAVLTGDGEQGKLLARQAEKRWKSGWKTVALAADHSPMDEIDGLFAQIDFFARTDDRDRLGAYCAQVAELVEAIADAHTCTWWNIL